MTQHNNGPNSFPRSLGKSSFTFVDLFCGIGGFHAALSALGGKCVFACEIDENARRIYERNYCFKPAGDVKACKDRIPKHDILVGGFPCQPFSKSGHQRGMSEARGTLFWDIMDIIRANKPIIVLLENVRNISGPRHVEEWEEIVYSFQMEGYRIDSKPFHVSPHQISEDFGGAPQHRDRVFIAATRYPGDSILKEIRPLDLSHLMRGDAMAWNMAEWLLCKRVPSLSAMQTKSEKLSEKELIWLQAWDDFVRLCIRDLTDGPRVPIWVDCWTMAESSRRKETKKSPAWRKKIWEVNWTFYAKNKQVLNKWLRKWDIMSFPASRRKFEWQVKKDSCISSVFQCLIQFRPSGIRVKHPNYTPALVAMGTQVPVLGPEKRHLSVQECAALQGLPSWFDFAGQSPIISHKQLGNAVNVGVVYQVLKCHVYRDQDLLKQHPQVLQILLAPSSHYNCDWFKKNHLNGSS